MSKTGSLRKPAMINELNSHFNLLKKYFFDLGSHLFESVYSFSTLYEDAFEYNVFCFEAAYDFDLKAPIDSALLKIHNELKFQSFSFLPIAASTSTTVESFKRDLSYSKSESSSLRSDKLMGRYSVVQVPTIDVAKFLKAVVSADDYCILKLDIEGSEYELIQHLHSAGALALTNRVYIELHEYKLSKDISKDFQLLDTLLSHDIEVMSWDAAGSIRNNNSKDHCEKVDRDYIRGLYGYKRQPRRETTVFQ